MTFDADKTQLPGDSGGSSSLSLGQEFGQYKVIRQLGRGGMGEVYEVEHAKLGSRHAVKLINQEIVERATVGQRFEREAKVMALLKHPNIVHVDDFGETDGRTWLRMELIGNLKPEGGDLKPEVNSLADLLAGEPLPEALVVDLLQQILGGLSYAHEQGVVHRDLKPANILIAPNPLKPENLTPKITDFGLVRLAGEQWLQSQVQLTVARSMADSTSSTGSRQAGSRQADPDATRLENDDASAAGTSTEAMLGTFEFMAPEQKKGQEADARSDLYAIGLIAFRMLTGEDSPGFEMPSQLVPGLSADWDAWVIKSLKGQADARFESAQAMLAAMPDGSAQAVSSSTSAPKAESVASVSKGGRLLWLWGLVGLVTIGAAGYFFSKSEPAPTSTAETVAPAPVETIAVDVEEPLDVVDVEAPDLTVDAVETEAPDLTVDAVATEAPDLTVDAVATEAPDVLELVPVESVTQAAGESAPVDTQPRGFEDSAFIIETALAQSALIPNPIDRAGVLGMLSWRSDFAELPEALQQQFWDAHLAACAAIEDADDRMGRISGMVNAAVRFDLDFGRKYASLLADTITSVRYPQQGQVAPYYVGQIWMYPEEAERALDRMVSWYQNTENAWTYYSQLGAAYARIGATAKSQQMASKAAGSGFQNESVASTIKGGRQQRLLQPAYMSLLNGDVASARRQIQGIRGEIGVQAYDDFLNELFRFEAYDIVDDLEKLIEPSVKTYFASSLVTYAVYASPKRLDYAEKVAASLVDEEYTLHRSSAYTELAKAYLEVGQLELARKAAKEVKSHDTVGMSRMQFVPVLLALGEVSAANAMAREAVRLSNNSGMDTMPMFSIPMYACLGDSVKLEAEKRKAADSGWMMMAASALCNMGEIDEAKELTANVEASFRVTTLYSIWAAKVRQTPMAEMEILYQQAKPGLERGLILAAILERKQNIQIFGATESASDQSLVEAEETHAETVVSRQDESVALFKQALTYRDGDGVPQDYAEALRLFRLSAAQGNLDAMNGLGLMYEKGDGVERNYAEAVKWYRSAADQGHPRAQASLGVMYFFGRGVDQDDAELIKWCQLALNQKDARAQCLQGLMYQYGRGVGKNEFEAIKWYRLSAAQGFGPAQTNLGSAYDNGFGVPKNDVEAARWYRLAAEQGVADSQRVLGVMYKNGRGVRQDDVEAVRWYRLAAEQGLASAQSNLGNMYSDGRGVRKNRAEAEKWYRLAADQGDAIAQHNLRLHLQGK